MGVPQSLDSLYIMENPTKIDALGYWYLHFRNLLEPPYPLNILVNAADKNKTQLDLGDTQSRQNQKGIY